ncbi:MAG: CRTAC1 family protein [Saprospiraceae bacterium]
MYQLQQNSRFNLSLPFFLLLSLAVAWTLSCTQVSGEKQAQVDNNQKMLDNMADVARRMSQPQNTYAGETRLTAVEAQLASNKDPNQQLNLAVKKANILLEIGEEAQAVALFEKLYDFVKTVPSSRQQLAPLLGMAYMRLAERTNCTVHHSSDACIMPIRGNGIHQDKAPSRKAVAIFETILKESPDDLNVRWLLNIAYMTLGEYPQKVPKAWLIPGLDAAGSNPVKPFTEIAGELGIDVKNRAGGSIVEDFNNDGYLDIVTSAWGLDDPMHFFKNNGDGTFTDASRESGLSTYMGGLNMLQADYNNDGNMDIFLLRGAWQGISGFGEQPNSLLRNNGNGTFTDVTIDAGMLTYRPTQTGTWNDFNHDGWLDLFVGNETNDPAKPYPCEFYINNQDGTFTNIVSPTNMNLAVFVKGASSGDYDNDGWPDIFLSCLSGEKILLRNLGVPGKMPAFENASEKSGFAKEHSSTFPGFFFDYDNDGWLDVFFCNYDFDRPLSYYAAKEALHPSNDRTGKISIYHNNQDGTYKNVSAQMHLNQTVFAMGSNFGDIDNDGWLDLYLATGNPAYQSLVPNKLYHNLGGKDFVDVTVSARVGNLQKGHAVSFADLNNNGDQDIYVDLGGAFKGDAYHASLYLNPGQNTDNNWICLKLEGTKSNRCAIGAKLKVKFHENGVERMVYREVNSGGSFGCSPLRREIGIGKAAVIDEITIVWPASGITQVLTNVKPNQFIKVKEGQDGFEPLALKTLVFKRKDGTIPMCAPAK